MNAILVALLLVPLAQNGTRAPASGDAQAGKALWEGAATQCKNCHGLKGEGAFGADFEWLKKMVYEHTTSMPQHWNLLQETPAVRVRMGNYSRSRLPESVLQEIWRFANDLGLRVPVTGQLSAGSPGADGVTYTLT